MELDQFSIGWFQITSVITTKNILTTTQIFIYPPLLQYILKSAIIGEPKKHASIMANDKGNKIMWFLDILHNLWPKIPIIFFCDNINIAFISWFIVF